jgi:hypothetical protein
LAASRRGELPKFSGNSELYGFLASEVDVVIVELLPQILRKFQMFFQNRLGTLMSGTRFRANFSSLAAVANCGDRFDLWIINIDRGPAMRCLAPK